MNPTVIVAIVSGISAVAVAFITATFQARSTTDDRLEEKSASVESIQKRVQDAEARVSTIQQQVGAVQGELQVLGGIVRSPLKVCSVFISGNWRDSIIVPTTWVPAQCGQFMTSVGADTWQLGCVSGQDFTWGVTNGGVPNGNVCKW
jgi:hypothetical protein